MPDLEIDVSGVDSTLNEIKRDLHRGMEKSMEHLVDNARDKARQVISENNAIFNAEVYGGFKDAETGSGPGRVRAKMYNDVDHAEVLEEGASFPEDGPPVEALLPWVARKMNWDVSGDFDSGGGRPDGLGGNEESGGGGEDNDHREGTDGVYNATGSLVDNTINTGDLLNIVWNDDTTTQDGRVLEVVKNNVVKVKYGEGSRYLNLDGINSVNRATSIEKSGESEFIEVEAGLVLQTDLGSRARVLEVDDDKEWVRFKFTDAAGTYEDRVDFERVRTQYTYYDGPDAVRPGVLEEDTTDNGLTLSKQADDLAVNSGSVSGVNHRYQREAVLKIESRHRDTQLPHVDSIQDGHYDTVEEAFRDDSSTINLPNNLLEWDTEFTGANIDGLIDESYYNVKYDQHLEYVIDHQYGGYLYDNLSTTGLNEFRNTWGFTETDDGWELPNDADLPSELAGTSERMFFSELFAERSRDGGEVVGWNRTKEKFFDDIEDARTAYYTDEFLDKPTGTPDYNAGYDYSGDREVVLEGDLDDYSTRDTEAFTTDFDNYLYQEGSRDPVYRKYGEYIFTNDTEFGFDGAKVLEHKDGVFYRNDIEHDIEDLTLQAVPKREQRWNQLENDDQILIEGVGDYGSNNGEIWSVEPKYLDSPRHVYNEEGLSGGENVFTGENVQIDYTNIIAYREEEPDLWAEGYEVVQTVDNEDVAEGLTKSFSGDEVNLRTKKLTRKEIGHNIVKDSSGSQYRAVKADIGDSHDFESLHPNEEGELLKWNEEDLEFTHLSENALDYDRIEIDDDILVDPDQVDTNTTHSDYTYRATVKGFDDNNEPYVMPFGQNTNQVDSVGFDAFKTTREKLPGWDAKNWDKGRKVTVDTYKGEKTGHLDLTERELGYELGSMSMRTEDGESYRFTAESIISSEDDGFMDRGADPNGSPDLSITEFDTYDGEVPLDKLRARDFDPLEGVDDIEPGTDARFDIEGKSKSGTVKQKLYDDNDNPYYRIGGYSKVYVDQITGFDGQGAERYEVSEGDTVSNGSSFAEILKIRDNDDNPDTLELDYDGDGSYEEVKQPSEIQSVDFSIPEGSGVYFWSYREGEWKTGKVTRVINSTTYIETADGAEYSTLSSLYPIEIFGVDY